ncbi:MAG: AcrR family transcriptional regulator [Myxococcota bacterium]|jgi:AcrR family transcriptional regulator
MSTAPTEGRRARNRRLKTDSALETALEIIEAEGIEGLTIGALARRLDWAMGAMYRYFPSKDALLVGLQARIVSQYEVESRAALASTDDPLIALVRLAQHYQAYFSRHRGQFALIAMSLSHPKQLIDDTTGAEHFASVLRMLQSIVARFEAARIEGRLGDGDSAQRLLVFWSAIMGVMQLGKLARLSPDMIDTRALIRNAVGSLLVGWGASAEAVNAAFEAELSREQRMMEIH